MNLMNQTESEIGASFSNLAPTLKTYVLSSLAHQLTVSVRAAYADREPNLEVIKKMQVFNELQHTVTGQLTHLMANDRRWYPDAVFIKSLFETARSGDCEKELVWGFGFALSHLEPPA